MDSGNLIAEDPGILGLGDLSLLMREKQMPGGGRLDLILGDEESSVRYEVEIQLGKTDPSHIIRVLEYWDLARKQDPHCDHIAVLIAEEITSRFFNVISLFNGVIPIIALQMKCVEIDNKVTIVFSKILDLMSSSVKPGGEGPQKVNRQYWENKAGKDALALVDGLLDSVNQIQGLNEKVGLEYRKGVIAIITAENVLAYCIPYKNRKHVKVAVKLSRTTDMDKYLSESDLDVLDYNVRLGRYRVRLKVGEENNINAVMELIKAGFSNGEA